MRAICVCCIVICLYLASVIYAIEFVMEAKLAYGLLGLVHSVVATAEWIVHTRWVEPR